MKVAFLAPSASRASGGIFEIERRLAQSLSNLEDTQVEVFGCADESSAVDLASWSPLHPRLFKRVGPSTFCYSPGLRNAFLNSDAEIAHLHALWRYTSSLVYSWSRKFRRPFILTANGMLEPWALRNSGWKKRLALLLYERKCLDRAACIQVNSEAELRSVRAFGLKNPVCVIPNGIDLPELNGTQGVGREAQVVGRKTLLYLGRIHPKKGLVNLLKAWRMALGASGTVGDGWVLAIAGWDQGGHEKELRILSAECGIEKSVAFLGPQFGEDKAKCYRDCDAVVLPSFSEGLPMAVLEAWSYGKPVLMTPECNLPEGFAAGAALRIESNPQSIARELQELFSAPRALRLTLGRNGRALVASRFTWQKVAREMSAVYEWVLGDTARPGCVVG